MYEPRKGEILSEKEIIVRLKEAVTSYNTEDNREVYTVEDGICQKTGPDTFLFIDAVTNKELLETKILSDDECEQRIFEMRRYIKDKFELSVSVPEKLLKENRYQSFSYFSFNTEQKEHATNRYIVLISHQDIQSFVAKTNSLRLPSLPTSPPISRIIGFEPSEKKSDHPKPPDLMSASNLFIVPLDSPAVIRKEKENSESKEKDEPKAQKRLSRLLPKNLGIFKPGPSASIQVSKEEEIFGKPGDPVQEVLPSHAEYFDAFEITKSKACPLIDKSPLAESKRKVLQHFCDFYTQFPYKNSVTRRHMVVVWMARYKKENQGLNPFIVLHEHREERIFLRWFNPRLPRSIMALSHFLGHEPAEDKDSKKQKADLDLVLYDVRHIKKIKKEFYDQKNAKEELSVENKIS